MISRHCKDHLLRRCTCDQSPKTPPEDGSFYWGGCGDNLDYGYQFSKGFSDNAFEGREESLTDYELMSKHNTEVGRLVRVRRSHFVTFMEMLPLLSEFPLKHCHTNVTVMMKKFAQLCGITDIS